MSIIKEILEKLLHHTKEYKLPEKERGEALANREMKEIHSGELEQQFKHLAEEENNKLEQKVLEEEHWKMEEEENIKEIKNNADAAYANNMAQIQEDHDHPGKVYNSHQHEDHSSNQNIYQS